MIALEPPRWPGGPWICPVANLPAFALLEDAAEFLEKLHVRARHRWRCCECGCWHWWGEANSYAPAGASSGNCRHSPTPIEILQLIEETKIRA